MKLYAQAAISISGFRYWFTQKEIAALNQRTAILEKINGGIKKPLSVNRVGQVMKKMGFESIRTKHGKSYHVLERKIIDIDEYQKTRPLEDTDQPF